MSLEPNNCVCPNETYTCRGDDIVRLNLKVNGLLKTDYSLLDPEQKRETEIELDLGVARVRFTRSEIVGKVANISSTLLITNLTALNGTNFTCEISIEVDNYDENTLTVCIIGKR